MWDLKVIDVDKPVYLAIADALERDIREGLLKPGDKLPTHRALAKKVGVTVTTATKAYKEAERRKLVTSIVGNGTFITSDRGAEATMAGLDASFGRNIEMGLVWPLHSQESGFLSQVLDEAARIDSLDQLMRYSAPNGLLRHREIAAKWVARYGLKANADRVIVTCGSQHAINCAFSTFFEAGDKIAVEQLTYPGVKAAARRYGLTLEGIPMDEEGLKVDELDKACRRGKIKGLYLTGAMQNPTNAVMSLKRKEALARLATKHNLLDSVYTSYVKILSHKSMQRI